MLGVHSGSGLPLAPSMGSRDLSDVEYRGPAQVTNLPILANAPLKAMRTVLHLKRHIQVLSSCSSQHLFEEEEVAGVYLRTPLLVHRWKVLLRPHMLQLFPAGCV